MPVLREKVAEAMELPIEDLLGKEIKAVILETFQDFLLSKNDKKVGDQVEEDEPKVEDKPATKKPKKDTEMKKKEDKTEKKTSSEASSKTKVDKVEVKYTSKLKSPSPSATSTKNSQIERLKSYVFKCGVRKNWYTCY